MYEQTARWNEYYRELEPARRRTMLSALCASEPDDGANAFRQALLEARHGGDRPGGREQDRFLYLCVSFVPLCQSARLFRRSAAKEIEAAMKLLRLGEALALGEAGEKALYWEIRNAAARYFKTCEGAGYNRALFGMMASGDEGRLDRICRDVWQMTDGLAWRARMEARMALWCRAVKDAYAVTDGGAARRLAKYADKMRGGR